VLAVSDWLAQEISVIATTQSVGRPIRLNVTVDWIGVEIPSFVFIALFNHNAPGYWKGNHAPGIIELLREKRTRRTFESCSRRARSLALFGRRENASVSSAMSSKISDPMKTILARS
jgi:hypothetical protein